MEPKGQVDVWSLGLTEDMKFTWERIISINSFGIPYTPQILHGLDILSILDSKTTPTGSNDDQRTEVVVSRRNNANGNTRIIYHRVWQMTIFVKSISMHRDGLFDV
ncbi:hypothetical protein PIB30_105910 [Stylosanthes scabra]|uniref:Uncharacterized protein n=1 Tax=Stylosanthes scabra TaxID=79078 RepID=A0ABU6UYJ4_9FABA|nr:hypothetical protein [Stylosanthes scabra]